MLLLDCSCGLFGVVVGDVLGSIIDLTAVGDDLNISRLVAVLAADFVVVLCVNELEAVCGSELGHHLHLVVLHPP